MKNNKILLVSFSIILISIVSYFFISNHPVVEETTLPTEIIAVVDIKKIVTQHPEYKKIEAMKNALNMVENYSKKRFEKDQTLGVEFTLDQEKELAKSNNKRDLQRKLVDREKDINNKIEKQMELEQEKINAKYNPEIFNIHLKFKTLKLGDSEAESLSKQLQSLLLSRDAELAEVQEKYNIISTGLRKQAQAEIKVEEDNYSKQIDDEFKNNNNDLEVEQVPVELKETEESKMAEIESLKLKIKQMEDQLVKEVKDETIKLAVSRKINVVFDNVFMNITAINLTDDVIAEINRRNN